MAAKAERVDEAVLASAFADAVGALEAAGIDYLLVGGLGSSVRGRPRSTDDIDFLVQQSDALRTLEALAGAGFETEETNPHWIYKAGRDGATIDVIFKISGDIYVDEEMLARSSVEELLGTKVRVVAAEDLIVIKAIAHDEPSFRHGHDALAMIAAPGELDWDYLSARARHGARRVLALLLYAQSNDLVVPEEPIRSLFETIYPRASDSSVSRTTI
jgi:predicted nucleotidyltransferase